MAAVRFAGESVERIILVTGVDNGSTGYRVDLQVAAQVMLRLIKSTGLPGLILSANNIPSEELQSLAGSKTIRVEPGIQALQPHLKTNDLVIAPGAVMRRLVSSQAMELAEIVNGISVMIAAGPYRLGVTGSEVGSETKTVINFGPTTTQVS